MKFYKKTMSQMAGHAVFALSIALGLTVAAPFAQAASSSGNLELSQPVTVKFATARAGTSWYGYAGSFRSAMLDGLPKNSSVNVLNTPMSIANTKILGKGRADVIMSFPPVVNWAKQGIGPFSKKITDIRGLVGGMDKYYQRITLQKNSKINSLAEIKEKHLPVKIGTASPGSLNEYICRLILKAYGLTYDDIRSYGGSVTRSNLSSLRNLFQDGRIDMIIGLTTEGHPSTAQLATAPGEKFLGLNEHAVKFLEGYGFHPATMPAHLFKGQDKPIKGVGFSTALYASTDMSNAEAYTLTKAIMDHRKLLKKTYGAFKHWTVKNSHQSLGVPLHPGAKTYFEQIGASSE
jgi:TRAP transporter TAXI family solute receptor